MKLGKITTFQKLPMAQGPVSYALSFNRGETWEGKSTGRETGKIKFKVVTSSSEALAWDLCGDPPNTSRGQLLPARGLLCTVLVPFPSPIKPLPCFHKSTVWHRNETPCFQKKRNFTRGRILGKNLLAQDFFWLHFSQMCHNLNVKMIKDFKKQKGLEDKEETRWVDKGSYFKLIEASRTWWLNVWIWGQKP